MLKRILLDLDGVLADFHGHSLRFFGSDKTVDDLHGETWIPDALGITEAGFWEKVNGNPESFWYDMPLLSDANRIVDLAIQAVGAENVGICSSPSRYPSSIHWKMMWVEKHFPDFYRRVVLTPAKYLLSTEGTLLIDDWEKNAGFADHGGSFFLIPRRWNSRHQEWDIATHVLEKLLSEHGHSVT